MGRKRSTWNRRRNADPYQMNQERNLPPVEKYLIGDPSAWAEDVHQELPDDEALGRNEVGLPNMPASNLNHKDVEEWNSGDAYDNASTFSPQDRDRSETPDVPVDQMNDRKVATRKQSAREVFAALERKAYHCTKIAQALLPTASLAAIEDQSYELMALPDDFVIAAVLRLAEEEDAEEKDEKAEDKEEMAEEKEEEKEGGKKKSSYSDAQIESMLREMLDEDDVEDMIEDEMEEHVEDMHADSMMHMDGGDMEEDPEIDAMLQDMMDHGGMDMPGESSTDFDIGMDPRMDVSASEAIAGDAHLQNLFNNTIPKEARQEAPVRETAKTAGVQSLGGRVKEAADTEEDYDLSKLWKHDPDISGTF